MPGPPAVETLGLRVVSVDPERGEIETSFPGRPEFRNPMGNIQGGFLAAMLDDTLGPALVATLSPDEFAPTIELKVNFLRPVAVGPLTGRGRVVHRAGSIAFLAGELLDESDTAVATASATARIIRYGGNAGPST